MSGFGWILWIFFENPDTKEDDSAMKESLVGEEGLPSILKQAKMQNDIKIKSNKLVMMTGNFFWDKSKISMYNIGGGSNETERDHSRAVGRTRGGLDRPQALKILSPFLSSKQTRGGLDRPL